jgi:F0F1-type ATP synthase epsilon subunit
MADNSKLTMAVKIYAPFKTYFDAPAVSVSAVNQTGPFDILPHHKNFMSLLLPCTIAVHQLQGEPFTLRVTRGVMHVKADRVTVFLDV